MNRWNLIAVMSILICLLIILPTAFAEENQTELQIDEDTEVVALSNVSEDVLGDGEVFFDVNVDDDGNGSAESPYKNFTNDRVSYNTVANLADGEYAMDNNWYVSDVSFKGNNTQTTILNGNGFTLTTSGDVSFFNITLKNIKIISNLELTATNTVFKECNSQNGGVIQSNAGSIFLNNCSFYNNTADEGGAIYMTDGTVDVINTTFENNSARFGGAIYLQESELTIIDSTFRNNRASAYAGAIISIKSKISSTNSLFANNSAEIEAGAIYLLYGEYITIAGSKFSNNSAQLGGALFADGLNNVSVINNTFENNHADIIAGAVYSLANTNATISDNTYINNTAGEYNDLLDTVNPYSFIGDSDYIMFNYNGTYEGELPSYYSLKDLGYVTPVKQQGSGGNCWSFAALAALESCILKAAGISYDLSEENMKNLMAFYSDYGWNMQPNKGGYDDMAVGYLISWLGAVNETDDAYSPSSILSPILHSFIHVQNVMYITRNSYTDNDEIKKAIMDYGAVSTSIYWGGTYKGNNRYYNGTEKANHAIVIVGWDDNYSKNNFAITPPGDGAWIIKNSHGTSSGKEGYWYVSYYDVRCAQPGKKDTTYTFILNDTIRYDKNYQYDIPGKTDFFYNSSSTVWYKNIFNATANEYLAAVSTFFTTDTNYTVSIIVNDVLKHVQSGFSKEGYYTINLNQLIPLEIGDIFEVIFKITVDGEAGFPISEKVSLKKCFYRENISFLSYDGENWSDLFNLSWKYSTHSYASQVACIKAFTVFDLINTTISLNVTVNSNPSVITAFVNTQNGEKVYYGNVTFTVEDKVYTVDVVNGIAVLNYTFDSFGLKNISVKYENSFCYNNCSGSKEEFIYFYSTVQLNVSICNPCNITARAFDQYGNVIEQGYIRFSFNDEKVTVQIVNGTANMVYVFENSGYNNVSAAFDEYGYIPSSANVTEYIYLDKVYIGLNITKSDEFNAVVDVTLSHNFNNTAVITVNRNNYNYSIYILNITNGKAQLPLNDLLDGTYTVSVSIDNDTYYFIDAEDTFTIDYIKTYITANNVEYYYNGAVEYYAYLYDIYNLPLIDRKVVFTVNGLSIDSTTDSNGKASVSLDYEAGSYQITISFKGEGNYYKSSSTKTITVKTTLTPSATSTYALNSVYTVSLLDSSGNPLKNRQVVIKVGTTKTYKITTDSNGKLQWTVPLTPGSYVLTITNPATGEVKSPSIKVVKRITSNANLKMYYGAGKSYKVRVCNDNGKYVSGLKVTFKINGKTYTRTTDKNGYASFKISLKPNTYTITATYNGYKVSNKVVVKTNLITKNISVKKGKTIKFSAKLLNSNGKILKNKKITFKFKGKTYKVKTNKKGIATLKVANKYKVGKYTIKSVYGSLAVKNTIKIKK